jgi:hypothetical protein
MKRVTALALFFVFFVTSFTWVEAAKPRVPKTSTTASKATGTAYSLVKLSRSTNSIKVTFLNLDKVSQISYLLSYNANGKDEGAGGSISLSGQTTDTRDLYFGTCSHGVCTPHRSIKNATITVTTKLKSGGAHTKRYRIKT